MQNNVTFSKKSGKGISHGVISELTTFFGKSSQATRRSCVRRVSRLAQSSVKPIRKSTREPACAT